MSNAGQFKHATKVIRNAVDELTTKIANAQPGDERDALEVQLKQLMADVGMEYTTHPRLKQADTSVKVETVDGGSTITTTETTVEEVVTERKSITVKKPSIWQRVKTTYSNNKKKFWAGLAMVVGITAGMAVYFVRKNGGATAPALSRIVEVTVETPADVPVGEGEVAGSVFARVGAWFVSAGSAIKAAAISAVNWVKALFTKTTKDVNVEIEVPAEAVPA